MRIVIDMQGAQTESRFRGIGRYTMAFAQAVVRNKNDHEIILALSSLFPETVEPIRNAFKDLLPSKNIRVWGAKGPVLESQGGNDARREMAELLRESFLASLHADIIHVTSLFEGYVDDAVTSIGRYDKRTPTTTVLYDLIPYLNPDVYLAPNPSYQSYYLRKIEDLKRADNLFAISAFSRNEGISALGLDDGRVCNISTAIDPIFTNKEVDEELSNNTVNRYNIIKPFVLYTGGADGRKNLPRLIEAYSSLTEDIRSDHQLVFAGKIPEENMLQLRDVAEKFGLTEDEFIFTGYVSDDELILLYNICKLYVFPSWHEGFGLPALEAMACGAPVIGANTSSLPEVIGNDKALFDPFDVPAITECMAEALCSESYRQLLRDHGLKQSKNFSWDETAIRAISAWENIGREGRSVSYNDQSTMVDRLYAENQSLDERLGDGYHFSYEKCLLDNKRSGIERQLFIDVSELCQRDAATGVQRVVRSYLLWLMSCPPTDFRVEPVYATLDEGYKYARKFTADFLGEDNSHLKDYPITWQQGDVFFALDMQHHVQLTHADFFRELRSCGVVVKFLVYDLLPIQLSELFKDTGAKELHEQLMRLIVSMDGAICISKATADALRSWAETQGCLQNNYRFQTDWVHIGGDICGSRPSIGLPESAREVLVSLSERSTFLCVSTLEPRKRQEQILEAIEQLWLKERDVNVVFVGQQGWKVEALAEKINGHNELGSRLFWLQGISDEYLEEVYSASTCLIAASFNEGFGLSLIEAAKHETPIIARDTPVFREVAGDYAYYFSGETASDLADAIDSWLIKFEQDETPSSKDMPWLTWEQSTKKLKSAILEKYYDSQQILVDISELVQHDARTGIQRVVRSVLKEWLINPIPGYRVMPVYATPESEYCYAHKFVSKFLGDKTYALLDKPVEFAPGDIFFALDLQPQVQVAKKSFYELLRLQGVQVKFMVYDLLTVIMPQYFPEGSEEGFRNWLAVVAESDGAICISRSVADELTDWLKYNTDKKEEYDISWAHLGFDVDNSSPTMGFPKDANKTLQSIKERTSFLMVGTLEPRKGHEQVLSAFENLWKSNCDINLVIVGKCGWMMEDFAEKIRLHPEINKRLIWLDGISDEYLDRVYSASTCLIAASFGEGFGLPLIEAAQHGVPILARDIPVFREVAGESACYFTASNSEGLEKSILNWMALYEKDKHPGSEKILRKSWRDCAEQIGCLLIS